MRTSRLGSATRPDGPPDISVSRGPTNRRTGRDREGNVSPIDLAVIQDAVVPVLLRGPVEAAEDRDLVPALLHVFARRPAAGPRCLRPCGLGRYLNRPRRPSRISANSPCAIGIREGGICEDSSSPRRLPYCSQSRPSPATSREPDRLGASCARTPCPSRIHPTTGRT